MRYVADLHMHSRYSRATSKDLRVPMLDEWAGKKGVQLLGTGDVTHPYWLGELQQELEPAPEDGLYVYKQSRLEQPTRFVPSVELSSIYTFNGKGRRIHTLVILPSLDAAREFNGLLTARGAKLTSDGRPILGLGLKDIATIAFRAHPEALVIPAHAWTPWFGVLGSMSGFDSIEEAFEELTPRIYAIETGLSSDPPMNWRVGMLDNVGLISSSDAHSPSKIAREATEIEGELSYGGLYSAVRYSAPALARERETAKAKITRTIEFFPEEGKYHLDGHRVCGIRWTPEERKANNGTCPVCDRPVTIGVLSRVDDLSSRQSNDQFDGAPGYVSLVPLKEIIAEALGQKSGTKAVAAQYDALIMRFGNELTILLDVDANDIAAVSGPLIGEGIRRMREGKLHINPGYDGEFGTIEIFSDEDRQNPTASAGQGSLF